MKIKKLNINKETLGALAIGIIITTAVAYNSEPANDYRMMRNELNDFYKTTIEHNTFDNNGKRDYEYTKLNEELKTDKDYFLFYNYLKRENDLESIDKVFLVNPEYDNFEDYVKKNNYKDVKEFLKVQKDDLKYKKAKRK